MSRAGDGDEEDFAGQADLWRANLERSLNGKRGRKALAELREALLALPERRLIANAFSTVGKEPEPIPAPTEQDPYGSRAWQARERNELLEAQGPGVCSVAAYVWHQRVKAGADPQQALVDLPLHPDFDDPHATLDEGMRAGLNQYIAWELMWRNDDAYDHLTPEARWQAVVDWIDQQLSTPANA
jgi:hypothetical protein